MGSKNKRPKRKEEPQSRQPVAICNPQSYLKVHPSWRFAHCDKEKWSISKELGDVFWDKVFNYFQEIETQTWENITKDQKKNHYIDLDRLNKVARDRFSTLRIEAESIFSLRLAGRHRIYGILCEDGVFQVLWYDDDHGDNDTCVCRSRKKHT